MIERYSINCPRCGGEGRTRKPIYKSLDMSDVPTTGPIESIDLNWEWIPCPACKSLIHGEAMRAGSGQANLFIKGGDFLIQSAQRTLE